MTAMANDELPLTMMASIDEVLSEHHANTAQVMAAGEQMILSAFGQIVDDCPTADHDALARQLSKRLLSRLQARIHQERATLGEA